MLDGEKTKTKRVVSTITCFVAVFLLIQSNMAFGGGWSAPWKKEKQATNAVRTEIQSIANPVDGIVTGEEEEASPEINAVSLVPNLFWVDCGPEFNCTNATLYYVDPSSATPTATLFERGIFVTIHWAYEEGQPPSIEDHSFLSGTLDQTTYQLTNLKTGYIFYFKGGKIWLVDTTTRAKRQLSTESGITPATLCYVNSDTAWVNTNNNTIHYKLKGPDGQCYTGDDKTRVVKFGMTATTAPIEVPNKYVNKLLLDGRYIVMNYNTYPWTVERCNSDLITCTTIDTFTNEADAEDYDKNYVVLLIDGKIKRYNYSTGTLVTVYTPDSNVHVDETSLDKNGCIYFSTVRETPPYTNAIRSYKCGSDPLLPSFSTTWELSYLDLEVTPTYIVYSYPNATLSAEYVRSIPKSGGAPIVISNASADGGVAGQYHFSEDTDGKVHRVNLDGTGRITRTNSQINGATYGGSADWFYESNSSTFRIFLSNIGNSLKSYAIGEDFTNSAAGISMGTIPINLSNLEAFDVSLDILGIAMKRFTDLSSGTDILLLKATTPSSLKRLTNSNGLKLSFEID